MLLLPTFVRSGRTRGEAGLSLLEILVALAVLGIGVGAATSYLWRLEAGLRVENAKYMQHHIADRILLALQNPDAIRNSINFDASTGNRRLFDCIKNGPCPVVSPNIQENFNLYTADPNSREVIAGDGVFYTTDGKLCTPPEPRCHFAAQVSFWGTCPVTLAGRVPLASCGDPLYLNFRFRVVPALGSGVTFRRSDDQTAGRYYPYPPPGLYDTDRTSYAVRLRTADVNLRDEQSCPANQYIKEITSQGRLICACVVPARDALGRDRRDPTTGAPICESQICPTKFHVFTGFDPITKQPKCSDIRQCSTASTGCPCKTVDLTGTGDCGEGFWMVSITYGECVATTAGKGGKGATEKVKCSQHYGRCCKLDDG